MSEIASAGGNSVFDAVLARQSHSFSPRTALGTTRAFPTTFCFLGRIPNRRFAPFTRTLNQTLHIEPQTSCKRSNTHVTSCLRRALSQYSFTTTPCTLSRTCLSRKQ